MYYVVEKLNSLFSSV